MATLGSLGPRVWTTIAFCANFSAASFTPAPTCGAHINSRMRVFT